MFEPAASGEVVVGQHPRARQCDEDGEDRAQKRLKQREAQNAENPRVGKHLAEDAPTQGRSSGIEGIVAGQKVQDRPVESDDEGGDGKAALGRPSESVLKIL